MSGFFILSIILAYFVVLLIISRVTSRGAENDAFFTGNRNSKWYLVSFGMIGASLSGVTFISIPGLVGGSGFSYMQIVIGYMLGYAIISFVLLPLYYKLNLTSIYSYLGGRYGPKTHKVGAGFFLISRILGASVRLFLVADILDYFVLSSYGIPFEVSVLVTLLLIYVYTYRGGIKTIVWTDTLQTLFMLIALVVSVVLITQSIGGIDEATVGLKSLGMTDWFVTDNPKDSNYILKGILGGLFITVGMTGLDQDMMQKNLTCRNEKEAKKNMMWFSIILFGVNFVFLMLGGLLFLYAQENPDILSSIQGMDLDKQTDRLFPLIALEGGLGTMIGITFLLGLVAAAYSSADSALTALTTSTSVDLFKVDTWEDKAKAERVRKYIHIGMTGILFVVILLANALKEQDVINTLFVLAGYTYGPLLGLFFFGIITKRKVNDNLTWIVCLIVPVIIFVFKTYEGVWFDGYKSGHEILGVNGLLCYLGLWAFSEKQAKLVAD
ncbi:sodium:solute symporter [Brumimicrobium glaciale]|uniref:Sodium:solute symporter n=1 Tax=Brumimicrobium glaciale TaxID=200475 RepID=A0A4Q4KJP1_9FLAO|nr:sodium:solute symporter [Brumimicrobium glaciale]RYM33553.1 sodium:solute symporter [Brumimicrobium glaciale]